MFQASITYLNSTSSMAFKYSTLSGGNKQLKNSNEGEEVEFDSKLNGVKKLGKEDQLSDEEKSYLEKLKKRDEEVRRHEQAHMNSAGDLASGSPNYEYKIGPDGKRYAVGGNVKIDTAKVPDDPEATIEKAKKIKKAALAPADPSPKDRQVAAQATKMEQQAKIELQRAEKNTDDSERNTQPELNKISVKYDLAQKTLKDSHKNYNFSGKKTDYLFDGYGKLNKVV